MTNDEIRDLATTFVNPVAELIKARRQMLVNEHALTELEQVKLAATIYEVIGRLCIGSAAITLQAQVADVAMRLTYATAAQLRENDSATAALTTKPPMQAIFEMNVAMREPADDEQKS